MRSARFLLLAMASLALHAADWEKSGNNLLNGTYAFRQVYYVLSNNGYGDLARAISVYGGIKFDGNGNYTISSSENARVLDSSLGSASFTATGTYSISASGYGFMSSPYANGDTVYGMVSAQGIFVGSSTDNQYGYNDMLVAAPQASPLPTASSFTGSWTFADFDLSSFDPTTALSLQIKMTPDGAGNLGTVNVSGYSGSTGTTPLIQNSSSLKYTFSGGTAVATFPSNGSLVAGQKYLYFSKDGNFAFGGSPNSFDMIVGVKTGGTVTAPSGLYFQAGMDEIGGELATYYGSFNALAAQQIYLGHQRVNDLFTSATYDYTYSDNISFGADGTLSTTLGRYTLGAGGAVQITSGVGPYLGLNVALKAPAPTAPSGVYLEPTGIVNSASNAPFTASIVPGELLTMYGSNLANTFRTASGAFPNTLAGVQVLIGGVAAPIYYVSPTQVSAIVPYGAPIGDVVEMQVNNNGTMSNVVTQFVGSSAPGVFTQSSNGLGPGAITHLDGKLVTTANPAKAGETVAVYLTGLGAVSPTIVDGAAGSADPANLNFVTGAFAVDVNGVTATNLFAGLAPGFSGLYQLNVTVPTGVATGTAYLGISGPDSYMTYQLLPVGTATTSMALFEGSAAPATASRVRKPGKAAPRTGAQKSGRRVKR